jgi:hypothetical protein
MRMDKRRDRDLTWLQILWKILELLHDSVNLLVKTGRYEEPEADEAGVMAARSRTELDPQSDGSCNPYAATLTSVALR